MTIERFKGQVPRCRNCNKPLRPIYMTEKEGVGESTAKRKVWLPKDVYCGPPDNPSQATEAKSYAWGMVYWSPRKKQWYYLRKTYKTKSRVFTGKFGCAGSGLFCQPMCGFLWACRQIREAGHS